MKYIICLLFWCSCLSVVCAQIPTHKGDFYFYWGYNRSFFSTSDIYFKGPGYAFTLYDVKATDRPSPFGKVYFRPSTISIPQYVYRLGYYLSDRWHLSIGVDHLKYVVTNGQTVEISGVIDKSASLEYAGQYLADTTILTPEFVRFEHTDGLNLASIDVGYRLPLTRFGKGRHCLALNFGVGGIWVATHTDSRIFGNGINNDFHISGFSVQGKTGLLYEYGKYLFALFDIRGGMVSLPWVQLRNWEPFTAEHSFFFREYYGAVGLRFRFSRPSKIRGTE
jgi:hypothetical protein